MGNNILKKFKESLISVLPILFIVLIISFTDLVTFSVTETIAFIICGIALIIGMALFNYGADISMTPMGKQTGEGLTKSKNIILLLLVTFIMGFLITIAEPDLTVLSTLVKDAINKTSLLIFVGIGVAFFLMIAVIKIILKKPLSEILIFFYMIAFMLITILLINDKEMFVPLSFDSGGVTTGPITVPFIMALGLGISTTIGGKKANENSFGLVALSSIGPIIAVIVLSILSKGDLTYQIASYNIIDNLGINILKTIKEVALEVFRAIGLIVVFFLILDFLILKLPKQKLKNIFIGLIFTYLGLVIFLSSVNIAFVPIGYKLGNELANNKPLIIVFSFLLGMLTVIAEPAVHVLNKQVEDVTSGAVSKKSMLIALSIGVGLAIMLSIVRIIFDFSILYYIIPGYCISLGLSFFVPKIYTAIAFDSGGVASGPLTSSFILPFAIGVCGNMYQDSEVLNLAFGIVAMVAMAPLITIQLLGFKSVAKSNIKERMELNKILDQTDKQIIYF